MQSLGKRQFDVQVLLSHSFPVAVAVAAGAPSTAPQSPSPGQGTGLSWIAHSTLFHTQMQAMRC